jgi:hypothetical protein
MPVWAVSLTVRSLLEDLLIEAKSKQKSTVLTVHEIAVAFPRRTFRGRSQGTSESTTKVASSSKVLVDFIVRYDVIEEASFPGSERLYSFRVTRVSRVWDLQSCTYVSGMPWIMARAVETSS